jgi:hypothetical protein
VSLSEDEVIKSCSDCDFLSVPSCSSFSIPTSSKLSEKSGVPQEGIKKSSAEYRGSGNESCFRVRGSGLMKDLGWSGGERWDENHILGTGDSHILQIINPGPMSVHIQNTQQALS